LVTLFHPFRRPSGIPGEDYDTAAGAEARTALVPHFEEKYLQVRQYNNITHFYILSKVAKFKYKFNVVMRPYDAEHSAHQNLLIYVP
jgi:hypothetical protein